MNGAVRRIIVGPTAAGKSALALWLAQQRSLAIVSADSRQLHQGFDIGTAKPTPAERQAVPHYGIDVVSPQDRYSAHAWAADAERWCEAAQEAGTPPVIVGGTGLYVKALVEPFGAIPTLDPSRRAALAAWLESRATAELVRWCARLDPPRAHLGRTQLLRAIETALLAGEPLSAALRPVSDSATHRPVRYLVVDPGPVLASRIALRVHHMIAAGFEQEVQQLMTSVPSDAPAWSASGYRVMRESVEGTRPRAEAIERVIIESRQYAKRQRTWFRHQLPPELVTHLDPDAPDAPARLLAWWDRGDAVTGHESSMGHA
ncbi:MAG: tRNA (adenosine(37)-N6)-dimethylallyltransferase MiaA [Gemmatimonadota bacterium]|nr:tRNA (adenosine(37)-N6)-dimethylallyltransferase MiaA [Gemmatimonadota bacterium]